jgi:galactose-1-phosphate uridylyltransferase
MGTAITVAATTWNHSRFQADESVWVIAVRAIGSRTQTCLRFRWEHLVSCEQIGVSERQETVRIESIARRLREATSCLSERASVRGIVCEDISASGK